MGAPDTIKRLVDTFQRNIDVYKNDSINETQLRREFLDPFFTALGWDVENKAGYADAYKDVIHEYSLKTKDVREAPDYCFRIGGTRKFFVEAKKPSVNVKDDIHPAFQLRSYAWSAKLPLSVLTDFEEFAVYDCRIPPNKKDKASNARIMFITYDQFIDKWDEIDSIFSREAILKGSFDKYVESNKKKKGTAEVDLVFLEQMEVWRKALAKNIALRNPNLSIRELNYSVQKTIDRIIFLRICEDRGIEDYGQLMSLQNGNSVYERLKQIFQRADEKYNSGLFHFENERDRIEPPDNLTLDLSVDDKTIKDIVKELYYPESPYEFSVLPADILGQVYEQFLGKVIRLTAGHQAVIEDKPEVKKAGGVYYTPTYIVDYIVNNTVGKIIGNVTTPKEINKIKILDPACGSGSFLLGAYQYLLDWHLKYYLKELETSNKLLQQKHPPVCINDKGAYLLTTSEKKRILLNNIYGVDIDSQAVEVTKLSLMLKVLEGESTQTLNNELQFFRERALPDLSNNIKCGNSLVGPDFYNQGEMNFLDDEEKMRINVFDWNSEFKDIMSAGGFDVVIGNPPYVDIKGMENIDVQYIFSKYKYSNNRINLFASFVERAFQVLNANRFLFSFIVPSAILTLDSYKALRKDISENYNISSIVRLPNESFGSKAGDVKVDTVIVVFSNKNDVERDVDVIVYEGYNRINLITKESSFRSFSISQAKLSGNNDFNWAINNNDEEQNIIFKCEKNSTALETLASFTLGITPYDKYKGHTPQQIENKVFHADYKKDDTYKKLLAGNDVQRYYVNWNGVTWISYGKWLGAPREQKYFTDKRIIVKQIIDWSDKRIWSSLVEEELYNTQNAFTLLANEGIEIEFLLGILNSKLMSFYHRKRFLEEYKMRFQKILIKDCKKFPVRLTTDRIIRKSIIDSVNLILKLKKNIVAIKTPTERTAIDRQIQATDAQIDQLVYQLYGLTQVEIKIVEGA
jgi:type I restriction-modification system DNA methylase subunit/predicted type IV restriction endonuclease